MLEQAKQLQLWNGDRKIIQPYFCLFAPNVTQHVHQKQGCANLMLIVGNDCPLLPLSCFLKFILSDLLLKRENTKDSSKRVTIQQQQQFLWDLICLKCIDALHYVCLTADVVEMFCWHITLCCSCKVQFILFIGTVMRCAINLQKCDTVNKTF